MSPLDVRPLGKSALGKSVLDKSVLDKSVLNRPVLGKPVPYWLLRLAVLLPVALGCGCGGSASPAIVASGPTLDLENAEPIAAWQTLRAPKMATVFEITLPGTATATAAAKLAFAAFDEVERRMTEWRADSELAQLSRAAGGPAQVVSADLFALLTVARHVASQTDGAFDPTWAALWGLWDFRAGAKPVVPEVQALARQVALVGWQRLELNPRLSTARLRDRGMVLGLGGIAKGWALDQAAAVLRHHGVPCALLNAGGQLLALGSGPHGPWLAGLRDPRGQANDLWATLELHDGESLATSGDYEHYFEVAAVRYHHVLDPRTGWPAKGGRAAVVLVGSLGGVQSATPATLADALGKPLLILGQPDGLNKIEQFGNAQGLVVDHHGQWHASAPLRARLRVLRPPSP